MNIISELKKFAASIQYADHQKEIAEKLKTVPGLVVYHGLGSGKTLTAVNAAEKGNQQTTVVTPASLQENFKKEIKKAKGRDNLYRVTSYDKYNTTPLVMEDRGLLVLDEAHRLKNTGTKTFRTVASKRPFFDKALLLTGTPIQNYPHEIAPLVDIAANKKVLPLDQKTFDSKYIEKKEVKPGLFSRIFRGAESSFVNVPKNLDDFKAKASPYVDFYDVKDKKDYPSRTDHIVPVPMSEDQTNLQDYYMKQLPKGLRYQIQESLPASKRNAGKLNSFISATRQLSNTTNAFVDTNVSSPKTQAIVDSIKKSKRPSIVYSNYLASGILPVGDELTKAKIPHGVFTGKLNSRQKKDLVDNYNKGKLKALLISSSGGEGLDLKNTDSVHIMEPHWNEPKIDQVIGRAIRYKSHSALPEKDRNVNVYQYISDYPNKKPGIFKRLLGIKPTNRVSADEYLVNMSKRKKELNDAFTSVLKDK